MIYLIFQISLTIPFESNLIKFDTPNDAFHYTYINENIIKVIESDNCAFIFYGKDGSEVKYTYVDKDDNKWRLHNPYLPINFKSQLHGLDFVTRITDIKMHKQLVVIKQGALSPVGTKVIKDNQNSEFKYFSCKYSHADYYIGIYYAVIDSDLKDYTLTIDGEAVDLKN